MDPSTYPANGRSCTASIHSFRVGINIIDSPVPLQPHPRSREELIIDDDHVHRRYRRTWRCMIIAAATSIWIRSFSSSFPDVDITVVAVVFAQQHQTLSSLHIRSGEILLRNRFLGLPELSVCFPDDDFWLHTFRLFRPSNFDSDLDKDQRFVNRVFLFFFPPSWLGTLPRVLV